MIHYLNQTVHTPYGSLLESDCSYPIWFIARIRLFVPHMVHCSNQTVRPPYGPLFESDCSYPIWSIVRIRLFVPHMVHCSNQTVRTPYGPLFESDCSVKCVSQSSLLYIHEPFDIRQLTVYANTSVFGWISPELLEGRKYFI